MDPHTTQLLADLREAAALPAECARAMPAGLYHSEEIYRLEQERIFGRGWLCAGRAAELQNAGDYLTFSIANQPILGLYRGVQAPRARGGSLSWLERELHDFTRYLARMLTSDALA
jgi:hypothetical protein